MKQDPEGKIRCPLCGHFFFPEEQACGGRCGLLGNCGLACCPGCGYSFVSQSKTVRFFRNLLNRKRGKEPKP